MLYLTRVFLETYLALMINDSFYRFAVYIEILLHLLDRDGVNVLVVKDGCFKAVLSADDFEDDSALSFNQLVLEAEQLLKPVADALHRPEMMLLTHLEHV